MDVTLYSVKWTRSLVYLDEIVIFSRTGEDHMAHVGQVLTILDNAGLKLKLKKGFFFSGKKYYLGNVIRPGCQKISDTTTKDIQELQDRTT